VKATPRPALSFAELYRRLPTPRSADDLELGGLLGLSLFLLIVLSGRDLDLLPSPVRLALVLSWPIVVYAFVVSGRASIPVAYIVLGAIGLRLNELQGYGGSDVLDSVFEAIGVLLAGSSPYGHSYTMTQPPGSPMPYPPATLLLHLPGHLLAGKDGVFYNEAATAGVVIAALVALAARVSWTLGLPALAAYAALGNLVYTSADGSNDTSTGAMLLLAVLAVAWAWDGGWDGQRVRIAGLAAALALATKQSSLFVVVLLAIAVWQMAGRRSAALYVGAAGVLLLALSIPFLLLGPVEYVRSLTAFAGVHEDIYGWTIWAFAQGMGWPVLDVPEARLVNIVLTLGALLAVTRYRLSSIALATAFGVLVTLVLFLTARWMSFAYFAMVTPIILVLPLLAAWAARGPTTPVEPKPEVA